MSTSVLAGACGACLQPVLGDACHLGLPTAQHTTSTSPSPSPSPRPSPRPASGSALFTASGSALCAVNEDCASRDDGEGKGAVGFEIGGKRGSLGQESGARSGGEGSRAGGGGGRLG